MSTQTQLEEKSLSVLEQAQDLRITDQASYERACTFLTDVVKSLETQVNATFDPIVRAAYQAHREAILGKDKLMAPLRQAEAILKTAIGAYTTLQEQERQRTIERAREVQEQLHAEALEAAAIEAERRGATVAEVEAIFREPFISAPVVGATLAKAVGISARQNWAAEVTSLRELTKAVAEGRAPEMAIQANMTYLNGRAHTDKSMLSIPGVRPVCKTTVSARAR